MSVKEHFTTAQVTYGQKGNLPQIIVPHLKLELPVYSMVVSPQEREAYTDHVCPLSNLRTNIMNGLVLGDRSEASTKEQDSPKVLLHRGSQLLEFRWWFVFKMKDCPSILVVDDDQYLTDLLERILKEEGYQVTKAYDGNSALALLEKGYRPNLIVLDIIMSGVDGFEVLEFVRSRYDIPVIMITAKRDEKTLLDAFNGGADDYMKKPFRMLELLAHIKAKLRRAGPGVT